MSQSLRDPGQVLKGAWNEEEQALNVTGNITVTNPSVGPNGQAIPADSNLVGSENPSGNLEPLQSDASGNLKVNVVAGTISAENPSVSTTGSAVPSYGTYLAVNEGGNLTGLTATTNGLKVDGSAVTQPVSAASLPLPLNAAQETGGNLATIVTNTTGVATAANQATANTALSAIESNTANIPSKGSATTANSLPVNIASDQTVPVSASSLPLPTGAATAANQTTANTSLATIATNTTGVSTSTNQTAPQGSVNGGTAGSVSELSAGVYRSSAITLTNGQQAALPLDASGNLLVSAKQTSTPWTVADTANVSSTGSTSPSVSTSVAGVYNSTLPTVTTGHGVALQVDVSGRLITAPQQGRSSSNAPVYNAYTSTNVTTSAYVQLVASTTAATNMIEIFDSSGQSLILGVGPSGTEVVQLYTLPGGNGQVPLSIPAGSRVAVKALTGNATSGYLVINFYS